MGALSRGPLSLGACGLAVLLGLTLARDAVAEAPPLEVQEVADTGSMPKGALLARDGSSFFVTDFGNRNGGNVTIYDARTLKLLHKLDVPGIVVESVLSPDGATLYVSNFERGSVQAIDLATRRVKRELTAGLHPKIMVLSADGSKLFAANWSGESVTELDTATGKTVRTLSVGLHPRGMALTKAGKLFVANFDGASIDVFDGPDLGHTYRLAVCRIPRHLALSPDERTLYISCYHDSELHALDVETEIVSHVVKIGTNPKSIEVSTDGRYVFSADYGEDAHGMSVVDTTDWTARIFSIPGMDRGSGIAVTPDGQHALVTGWYDNHVYLVGFAGTGGHPEEAMKRIQGWVRRPHYHPPKAPGE
jgi:YVTN family beta-propeller protein